MAGLRLDSTAAGSFVVLEIRGKREYALFLGVEGEGEDRNALFVQPVQRRRPDPDNDRHQHPSFGPKGTPISAPIRSYEWRAYRFQGRWAVGSSADTLRLVDVLGAP